MGGVRRAHRELRRKRSPAASRGFELHRWETPVLVLALAYIVLELAIFRDASFEDPWIYVLVMAAIAIFYFAYLLVRRGRHGLTMRH